MPQAPPAMSPLSRTIESTGIAHPAFVYTTSAGMSNWTYQYRKLVEMTHDAKTFEAYGEITRVVAPIFFFDHAKYS